MALPFNKTTIFEYQKARKKVEGIIKISFVIFILFLITGYIFGLFKGTFLDYAITFLKDQFFVKNLYSVLIVSIIGGLFFVSVPLEALFLGALHNLSHPSWLIFILFLTGLTISYLADYYLGIAFSRFATKLISPKQFYKIKVKLNKYGSWLVFLFNFFPLPSQPLTFICGVFRYNRTRYFTIWGIAWVLKLILLILIAPYAGNIISFIGALF